MIAAFQNLAPTLQALLAGCLTWFLTALGASLVFFTRNASQKLLDWMLGFAAGIMIAASFWSLLAPAIAISKEGDLPIWLPASVGFLLGGGFLRCLDKILPHLHIGFRMEEAEGVKTSWQRSILLVLAITLHNIPEGLAIGVAFGALSAGLPSATLPGAIALTIGIGIQNFPEGLAVSMPLRREGLSRLKSFWYGQLSGLVEPLAALMGAAAILLAKPLLPYALGFAAGAMIFVVVEEVIPEAQREGNTDLTTAAVMIGFTLMMILDSAFA
ncbi:MAG: dihydroorotate dehydrogenase [Deltaproteobacteria bacterium RIFCSPLOWO2_02_FULL_50_16]|nr:MAG: dihydroorotate dehydrogenase [Deltaproteobacteria bacterium GWA2_50_8]OGQ30621.1 MAG: dihydroorotate dehydrogenase [Deltaproteobacteria bacterium RIFCSPHIGHO2_02_FULL_50_15]OGQ58043.1 MAG: dihydroorotate dehydrogenase [Deltaproteobacteria bacterium RIFCSPLOWO2_02_FULL_50_16]OGQ67122.1 MAG: dihydroorotate dehydrogenase [Deltaproteobacteria bacterium RIFCSPLOWO2_12_FULL_50_11]